LYLSSNFLAEEWIDTVKDIILTFSNVKAKYLSVECLRTECTVSLKIIEVKFYGSEEKRDTFCTIYGDSTALARTSTVFLSERPLFLEEFEFDGIMIVCWGVEFSISIL
jgi:hypothetical protein